MESNELANLNARALLIIGPTAVGKSSVLERALGEFRELVDIITFTTRPMRASESEGQPYHFVSDDKFKQLISQDFFLEWANVHGRLYGTPKDQIQRAAAQRKVVAIDIDVQGAKTLRSKLSGRVVTVFLMPPNVEALRQRFMTRGITSLQDLENRLRTAQTEMAQATHFDHVIVNSEFEVAYGEVRKVIENLLKNQ